MRVYRGASGSPASSASMDDAAGEVLALPLKIFESNVEQARALLVALQVSKPDTVNPKPQIVNPKP